MSIISDEPILMLKILSGIFMQCHVMNFILCGFFAILTEHQEESLNQFHVTELCKYTPHYNNDNILIIINLTKYIQTDSFQIYVVCNPICHSSS